MVQLLKRMEASNTEQFSADDRPCVLLIEDSSDLQTVIQLCLELMAGIQVITSRSTDDWMQLIKRHHPDVIVLALFSDDDDVLTALKNNPYTFDIPVVGLVVRDRPQDILRAKANGASAIVSKPFDIDILRDTIFDLLA